MSYTNKTQPTVVTPEEFLRSHYADKERIRSEAMRLVELYSEVTGSPCIMWNKIFGFGKYYYNDSKGGEHSHLLTGFAISSTGFTLYNMMGWDNYAKDIEKLGKYKLSGKSCLAIKSIEDIDHKMLAVVIKSSFNEIKKRYKTEK